METKVSTTILLERLGALISKDGSTKTTIEQAFKTRLMVQSENGIVSSPDGTLHLCPDCAAVVLLIGAWFSK